MGKVQCIQMIWKHIIYTDKANTDFPETLVGSWLFYSLTQKSMLDINNYSVKKKYVQLCL